MNVLEDNFFLQDEGPAWIEKTQPAEKPDTSNPAVKGPKLEVNEH